MFTGRIQFLKEDEELVLSVLMSSVKKDPTWVQSRTNAGSVDEVITLVWGYVTARATALHQPYKGVVPSCDMDEVNGQILWLGPAEVRSMLVL